MAKQPYTITIIDDNDAVRRTFKDLLEHYGYVAVDYPSGDSFLERNEPGRSDCILLDLEMRGRNGLDVLAHLRESNDDTPVIVISGTARTTMLDEARRLNADTILEKPINPSRLIKIVGDLLHADEPDERP